MKTINEGEFRYVLEEMILADLKHSQLLFGLANLGLDPMDNHYLGLSDLIAFMLDVHSDLEKDQMMEVYLEQMHRSADFSVSSQPESLRKISRECLNAILRVLRKSSFKIVNS